MVLLTAGVVPLAYGHGLGFDSLTVNINGTSYDITAEIPTEFSDDSGRLTVTIDEAAGDDISDAVLWLGIVHTGEYIFQDTFFAPGGVAALHMGYRQGDTIIDAQRQDGVISADADGVEIRGPFFDVGGLYTIHVRPISINGVDITDDTLHILDLLVLDEDIHTGMGINNQSIQFTTKSYFDRISNLQYDADLGRITFEMPFDWSASRISHIPAIHQEVHFPKDFEEFVTRGYIGKINNVTLFRSSVTVDDFTNIDERTVHFVILQDHINIIKSRMDRSSDATPDTMAFTLEKTQDIRSQLSAYSRNGDFQVDMTWEPEVVLPEQETKFIFTIRDAYTGETIRNSAYDFIILQDNSELYKTSGVAQIGGDFQEFTFSEEQGGTATVRIENIRGTDQSVEFYFAVAPEFGVFFVLIISVMTLLILTRGILPYGQVFKM
ncbi:MAG: peptidase [Cenarchaeum sp. SB0667_bin_13]|nr:peptidase [Cenarchaeum sp. SB0667_bin_13]